MNVKKIIRLTFWSICLPFLMIVSVYEFLHHHSPMDSLIWQFAILLCMPMLSLKAIETSDKSYESIVDEFRQMTNQRFLECENEVMGMPCIRGSAIFKEAYKQAYRERWNREYDK